MKIGIIGTGNMGRTLGGLWAVAGHDVIFGARRHEAAEAAAEAAIRAGAQHVASGSNDEAATADVALYCVRGVWPVDVLSDPEAMAGKVVIDINNSAIPDGFAYEPVTTSLAERLQEKTQRSHVVKAFNTMASAVFELDPVTLRDRPVTVFIAGDHEAANETVAQLARDIGLSPRQAGGLRNARLLESVGDLIRYFIFSADLGPFATLNIDVLPPVTEFRFATDSRFVNSSKSKG